MEKLNTTMETIPIAFILLLLQQDNQWIWNYVKIASYTVERAICFLYSSHWAVGPYHRPSISVNVVNNLWVNKVVRWYNCHIYLPTVLNLFPPFPCIARYIVGNSYVMYPQTSESISNMSTWEWFLLCLRFKI